MLIDQVVFLLQFSFFVVSVADSNGTIGKRCVASFPEVSVDIKNSSCLPYQFPQTGYCKDRITWKIYGSVEQQNIKEGTLKNYVAARNAFEDLYQFRVTESCEKSFNDTYCRNRFPACDDTTEMLQAQPICRETCEDLYKKCYREFKLVELINKNLVGTNIPNWRVMNCTFQPWRNGGESPECYYSRTLNTETDKLKSPDCYYGNGLGYHGNASMTRSGHLCQEWSSQCPHRHHHPLGEYPELVNASNWCRNPGGQAPNGPWCYTLNKTKRWEYCGVRKCPPPAPTLSPVIIKAVPIGPYRIFLAWRPVPLPFVHGTPKGFKIQNCVVGDDRYITINTTTPNSKDFEVLNLQPSTKYNLSVLEFNEHGDGPWSTPVYVQTMPENFISIRFTLLLKNKRFTPKLLERSTSEYLSLEQAFKSKLQKLFQSSRSRDYSIFKINIIKFYNGSVGVEFDVTAELINNTTSWSATQCITGLIWKETRGNSPKSLHFSSLQVQASPPPPVNLTENNVTTSFVTIGWSEPAYHGPYNITSYTIEYKKTDIKMQYFRVDSVGSDKRTTTVKNLEYGTRYLMRVVSVNAYGRMQSQDLIVQTKRHRTAAESGATYTAIIILLVAMSLVLSIIVVLFWRWWRKKLQKEKELTERIKRLMENPYDPEVDWFKLFKIDVVKPWWEIPRGDLTLQNQIGSGAFGVVYQGFLKFTEDGKERGMYCAVKMLKENSTEREVRDLCREIKIMSSIGDHPNIVSLIGACTTNGPPLLVAKFAPNGCLLDYIKENRTLPAYENQPQDRGRKGITAKERLRFAHDIAQGMSYLESQKYVHRDLAARNILLGKDMVAMVSDFGLSRDVYESGVYENTSGGILPVRWMAPESLQDFKYNTATDVWSYGVLLWEMENQGLVPYGGLSGLEILHHLQQGYRLPKPRDTSRELYSVMWKCWSPDPKQRPTFFDLVYQVGGLLAGVQESNSADNHIYHEPVILQNHQLSDDQGINDAISLEEFRGNSEHGC